MPPQAVSKAAAATEGGTASLHLWRGPVGRGAMPGQGTLEGCGLRPWQLQQAGAAGLASRAEDSTCGEQAGPLQARMTSADGR